jgi:hypothetical protein
LICDAPSFTLTGVVKKPKPPKGLSAEALAYFAEQGAIGGKKRWKDAPAKERERTGVALGKASWAGMSAEERKAEWRRRRAKSARKSQS